MPTDLLSKNFQHVYHSLIGTGLRPTAIAKAMGYTTTSQLNNTLEGGSQLSTKAIMGLIDNLNVSPAFLFLGQGEPFRSEETDLQTWIKRSSEWERKYFDVQNELFKSKEELEKAVHRYNKLIDITSLAMEKKQGEIKEEDITAGE